MLSNSYTGSDVEGFAVVDYSWWYVFQGDRVIEIKELSIEAIAGRVMCL